MSNLSLEEFINRIKDKYYEVYSYEPVILMNFVFTKCLSEAHFELRPDMKESLIEAGILDCEDYGGRMVLPKKTDEL